MPREDFDRRRLRGIYERNKRRVSALADARDSRRVFADEIVAPRRFIVSERRTRLEGFGRGGYQVRRVVRRSALDRGLSRFSDRGIFRRGHRDRFMREEDQFRRDRRERFLDDNRRFRDMGPRRRFGFSRRRRLQIRERERRREDVHSNSGRHPDGRRNSKPLGNRGRNPNNSGNYENHNRKGRSDERQKLPRHPLFTRDELDAQLDSYRNAKVVSTRRH